MTYEQKVLVGIVTNQLESEGLDAILRKSPFAEKVQIGPIIYRPTRQNDLITQLQGIDVALVSGSYGGIKNAVNIVDVIRQQYPEMGIVGLSSDLDTHDDSPSSQKRHALDFRIAGANAYIDLIKDGSIDDLNQAISIANEGGVYSNIRFNITYMSKGGRESIIDVLSSLTGDRELSPKEQKVLLLTLYGFSRVEICEELVLADVTVKKHLQRIYRKLDIFGEGPTHMQELLSMALVHLATGQAFLAVPDQSLLSKYPTLRGLWSP